MSINILTYAPNLPDMNVDVPNLIIEDEFLRGSHVPRTCSLVDD